MPSPEPLGRNGTYAVYRKLQQHVAAFRDYLQSRDDSDLLAAKLMGRWPRAGRPRQGCRRSGLAADPHRNNRFCYSDDPLGFACPRGAHIRRAQPRDNAPPAGAGCSFAAA